MKTYATNASFSLSDSTWASSVGGPGLNLGEHIAGRSRFGTRREGQHGVLLNLLAEDIPRNPSVSRSSSGSAISAFTPHTTVVSPKRTSAEPSAVDIDPGGQSI